ncbi:hypothetical protein F4678DRAFT_275886 [Xylaria arbuscula]|nr:hypothetical protein F4678DRAFT_275886 [Xylaria arbuscula]
MPSTYNLGLLTASCLVMSAAARSLDWAASVPTSGLACLDIGDDSANIARNIGSQLFADAAANDCTLHTGSIDNLFYEVYATTTGGDCSSTAQVDTIEGGLNNAIGTVFGPTDAQLCGSQCIKVSHGGTWTGWVSISTDQTALQGFVCDDTVALPTTGSCGNSCI